MTEISQAKENSPNKLSIYWEDMSEADLKRCQEQLCEMKIGGSDEQDIMNNVVIDKKRLVIKGKNASEVIQGIGILTTLGIEAEKRGQQVNFRGHLLTSGIGINNDKGELISIYRSDSGVTEKEYKKVLSAAFDAVKAGVSLTSGINIPNYRDA